MEKWKFMVISMINASRNHYIATNKLWILNFNLSFLSWFINQFRGGAYIQSTNGWTSLRKLCSFIRSLRLSMLEVAIQICFCCKMIVMVTATNLQSRNVDSRMLYNYCFGKIVYLLQIYYLRDWDLIKIFTIYFCHYIFGLTLVLAGNLACTRACI